MSASALLWLAGGPLTSRPAQALYSTPLGIGDAGASTMSSRGMMELILDVTSERRSVELCEAHQQRRRSGEET